MMAVDPTDQTPEGDGFEQLDVDEGFHKKLCGMLDRMPLLQGLEYSEIEQLARYCSAYKVAKGVRIFREGAKSNFMCLLTDGYVALMKGSKQLATVREGKTMGEMSMIDGNPYSATAISAADCRFVLITRTQFGRLADEHPRVAFKLLSAISKLLSIRLRETTDLLVDRL